jgi:hypothetical protein
MMLRRLFSSAAKNTVPINILKAGADPVLKPSYADYPAWLETLATPPAALVDLAAKPWEQLTAVEKRRYFKLDNRDSIKKRNSLSGKK